MHETQEALIAARDQAQQANKAKSDFLTNMSHELRTPMHAIMSYSDLSMKAVTKLDANAANIAEKIVHYQHTTKGSAERLLHLLNDLLDVSKLESGKMEFDFLPHDMGEMIAHIVEELQSVTQEKSLHVTVQKPSGLAMVECDRHKIIQVLHNLLSNAIKFSDTKQSITIACHQSMDEHGLPVIYVAVEDEGLGIPKAELTNIFDKFIQSSNTKTGAGGTGLGLAICKEIIHAHGGNIAAKCNPARGATLFFSLPLTQSS